MSLLLGTTILWLFYSLINSEWISHSENTLPRDDTMCAIGSYNNRIFLLGGFNKMRQITNYDIQTDSFVLYQSEFIPISNKVFGQAQYYTQLGYNLYILDDLEPKHMKLMLYNMVNNSFISYSDINATISDGMGRACIASSSVNNTLYVNGGLSDSSLPMNKTHVLNMNTMLWSLAPEMQTPRRSHSCICDNNYLYSIGGASIASIGSLTATIEKISIVNIHENHWIYLNGELNRPLKGLRSIIYENKIIVIGGITITTLYDTVHIIDTITDTVTLSDFTLAFSTAYTAAIIVDNVMYAFGGGMGVDEWQSQSMSSTSTDTPFEELMPNTTFLDSEPSKPERTLRLTLSSTEQSKKSDESDGLVTGNKVGIGLAIGLFVCLILVVAFFFIHGRRNKRNQGDDFSQIDGNDQNQYSGNSGVDEDDVDGQLTDEDDEKLDTELVEKKITNKDTKEYV